MILDMEFYMEARVGIGLFGTLTHRKLFILLQHL